MTNIPTYSLPSDDALKSHGPRIDYVDLLKGIAILWIIWFHADCYSVIRSPYRNPIFFFTSGIFFKVISFDIFTLKRINRILMPLVLAYILSFFYSIPVYLWDNHGSIAGFDWSRIFDFFKIDEGFSYLGINTPLWFLMCLLTLHFLFYPLAKLSKKILFAMAFILLASKEFLLNIPTPFMINNALYWAGFFIIGYTAGRWFVDNIKSTKARLISLILSLTGLLVVKYGVTSSMSLIHEIEILAFIFLSMSLLSFCNGWKQLDFIRFFGKNSMTVLIFHYLMLIPFIRLIHKFYPEGHPLWGLLASIIVAFLLVPIINYTNKTMPILVGKGDLIPFTKAKKVQ